MKKKIENLLISSSKYRKSDNKLMARIWYDHLKYKINNMSAVDLLNVLSKGDLPNWETCSRIRRKIQSDNINLTDHKVKKFRMEKELEYRMKYSPADTL